MKLRTPMTTPHVLSCFAAAAMVTTGLIAVSSTAKAHHPAGTGGELNLHLNRTISGFDHVKSPRGGFSRVNVMSALHETLFRTDPKTGEFKPQLAVKAVPSDNFKRWRVTLRDGVKFANGEPLTSEAYVVHFGRLLGSNVKKQITNALGLDIEKVVAVDRLTFDFVMAKPEPAFMASASSANNWPWYLSAPGFTKKHQNDPNFNGMIMGAGAYMLQEWIPKQRVVVVRNPHYYDKSKQHLDKITYRVITGPESTPYLSFLSGELDAFNTVGRTIAKARKDFKGRGFSMMEGFRESSNMTFQFNSSKPPFDDVRVRRAVAHAVNRVATAKFLTRNVQTEPSTQDHPPASPWHCPNTKVPEYSLEKAKALIKEYGKPVDFKLTVINHPNFKRGAQIVQEMATKAGFKVELDIMPRGQVGFEKRLYAGEMQAFVASGRSLIHPLTLDMHMHSKEAGNYHRTKSPKIDAAIENVRKAAASGDKAALKEAHCEFVQVKADEVPIINIVYTQSGVYYHKHVKGLQRPISNVKYFHEAWIEK